MKPFSNDLATLFEGGIFVSTDLYTIQLIGGGIVHLTSADHDVTWDSVTYLSGAPLIDRSSISQKTGLQVSTVKISVYPQPTDTIGGVPWLSALRRGMFDGASIQIDRAFAPNWTQPITGIITMLKGRVADTKFGRSKVEIDVNSWVELLSNQMPRTYYQSACNNTLYDTRCGIVRAAYSETGSILSVDSAFNITTTLPSPQNWFAYGVVTMTSGLCAGESRPVSSNTGALPAGNQLMLQIPFSIPPSPGDAFIAYAGCDKTQNTCQFKFGNLARFTGFPFIPAPETAV
jgi:uncharacterized phage protein (TIGR02218 family)